MLDWVEDIRLGRWRDPRGGVVHAGLIRRKLGTANRVLAPKVEGTRYSLIFCGRRLDFFVLFSSMAAIDSVRSRLRGGECVSGRICVVLQRSQSVPHNRDQLAGMAASGNAARLETLPGLERWKQDALGKAIATEKESLLPGS